jgi:hypothetical protein
LCFDGDEMNHRASLSQSLEFSQMQAEAHRRHAAGDELAHQRDKL